VVGSSIGDGTKMDLVTIAYDAATGEEIWARRYDGPAHGIDQGAAVAIDETNDAVVVTGGSERVRASGIFDVITIAYDAASGAPRYERRFSKRPSSSEVGGDVAAANGMAVVLVNGTVHGHLLAYDAEGDVMWQRWATRRNVSSLVDVEADADRVYVVGSTFITFPGSAEYFTAAYLSGDGSLEWRRRYDGPAHFSAGATDGSLSTDSTRLYVTGTANDFSKAPIATIAYDAATGARDWLRTIPPRPGGSELSPRVEVSADGTRVVVASTSFLDGVNTFLTTSYTASGAVGWTSREDGPDDVGWLTGLAVAPDGSAYLTGSGKNVGDVTGSITVAYGPTGGSSAWEAFIPGVKIGDGVSTVAVAPDVSRVFVACRLSNDIRTDAYLAT